MSRWLKLNHGVGMAITARGRILAVYLSIVKSGMPKGNVQWDNPAKYDPRGGPAVSEGKQADREGLREL